MRWLQHWSCIAPPGCQPRASQAYPSSRCVPCFLPCFLSFDRAKPLPVSLSFIEWCMLEPAAPAGSSPRSLALLPLPPRPPACSQAEGLTVKGEKARYTPLFFRCEERRGHAAPPSRVQPPRPPSAPSRASRCAPRLNLPPLALPPPPYSAAPPSLSPPSSRPPSPRPPQQGRPGLCAGQRLLWAGGCCAGRVARKGRPRGCRAGRGAGRGARALVCVWGGVGRGGCWRGGASGREAWGGEQRAAAAGRTEVSGAVCTSGLHLLTRMLRDASQPAAAQTSPPPHPRARSARRRPRRPTAAARRRLSSGRSRRRHG